MDSSFTRTSTHICVVCIIVNPVPGKKTQHLVNHKKAYSMTATLNERNLKQLESKGTIDADLGIATPTSIAIPTENVKAELPSLEPLQKAHRTTKNAYLIYLTGKCNRSNVK